jgi:DNA-binding transcriptional MerR regulator/methylmalonyl-CoA mutase cobalamin-binding subunit
MVPGMRIGAVARRTGVAVATLRAWESRYGLLRPSRTEGGHRLYAEDDVARVLAVLRLTAQGWSVSAAAAAVGAEQIPTRLGLVPDAEAGGTLDSGAGARTRVELDRAIRGFDLTGAETALDASLARLGVAYTLEDVVMPVMRDLGEGWEEDPTLIAVEHFATNTLRPRLHRLLIGARRSSAPTCIAAAPEGEDHELGVLAAAAVASDQGFSVTYLGARTPNAALERSVATLDPDLVLIGAVASGHAQRFVAAPPAIDATRLVLGGPGFAGIAASELPPGSRVATSLTQLPATLRAVLEQRGAAG